MFHNYLLYQQLSRKTYNGYTNDLAKRLRQHNGEILGGARSTSAGGPGWQYLAVISSPEFTRKSAMSFEWYVKHPTGAQLRPAKFNGPLGRLKALPLVLSREKFQGMEFKVQVCSRFYEEARLFLADAQLLDSSLEGLAAPHQSTSCDADDAAIIIPIRGSFDERT